MTENPAQFIHVEPNVVLENAEKFVNKSPILNVISANGKKIYYISEVAKNYLNPEVSEKVGSLAGNDAKTIYEVAKESLEKIEQRLKHPKSDKLDNSVFIDKGGDSLIIDPDMKGKDVEIMLIDNFDIGDKSGESVLVRMWKYGALKELYFPKGSGNQIEWEMLMCLKGNLHVVIPKDVKDENGNLVAQDNGIDIEIKPGDAILLPLIPRQVISADIKTTYFTMGPAWGGENGIAQKPVYWPNQIKK